MNKIFAMLLIVFLTGSQWLVLQGVAWAGMLIQYSLDENILVGVEKTFDGEHPCSMCRAIDKAKAPPVDTKQTGTLQESTSIRLDATISRGANMFAPQHTRAPSGAFDHVLTGIFNDEPPVPPPRLPAV